MVLVHLSRCDKKAPHDGRVVDFADENFLAEFSSALNATRCTVEIRIWAVRNLGRKQDRRTSVLGGVLLPRFTVGY